MTSIFNAIKNDAVIVLAHQMDENGLLNSESKARANKAVEILKEREISHIVTCGWAYRDDSDITIADSFKCYIVNSLGINPNKVITELNSRDTVGDAFFTKINLALLLNWKSLCVVTSDYHVKRAQEIFSFIYGNDISLEVYGVSVVHDVSIISNELNSIEAFRETFLGVTMGNNIEILKRLKECHPFYNGKVYKKI
jgi:uncharacterized SAM-binding protein YcdF (DUF218 family)